MTRIVVLLKDIVDLNELKMDPSTRKPMIEGMKRRISDLDKRALEAAIRLKEAHGGEVVTLSMGTSRTRTAMLEALAMGADASYIVYDDSLMEVDSFSTSKVLKAALGRIGEFNIIMGGEMSLDSLSAQIGPRLAEMMDLPIVTYAKSLDIVDGKLRAERDLEDMDEIVEVKFPVIASVVREINEPRIPSLINIMKAKRKPTEEWDASSLGLDVEKVVDDSSIEVLEVTAPIVERKRIVVEAETVEEAAEKLADAILAEGVLEA